MRPWGGARRDDVAEWWDQALTEARARLARIERGESWAPAQVVRCLRVLTAPDRPGAA